MSDEVPALAAGIDCLCVDCTDPSTLAAWWQRLTGGEVLAHPDGDASLQVGTLRIDFRDGCVHISAGEMFVVPKAVEHKPYAEREVKLLLIEPRGVLNTGHEGGERTALNDVWI